MTVPLPATAPLLTVVKSVAPLEVPATAPRAAVLADGGELFLDLAAAMAYYELRHDVTDDAMLHPWLAPAAALLAVHLGRIVLHGGVLAKGDRAVVVLGPPGAGKSTLSAWAAAHHSPFDVLADDLAFLDGDHVMAGPRCIDLRRATAARLSHVKTDSARGGTRSRLALGPCVSSARLAGFVVLAWEETLTLEPVAGAMRIPALLEHLAVARGKTGADGVLALADVPVWRLARPRRWDVLDDALRLIDEEIFS